MIDDRVDRGAARVRFARLLLVLVALAGLGLAHCAMCADPMPMVMEPGVGSADVVAHPGITSDGAGFEVLNGPVAMFADPSGPTMPPAGLMLVCVTVLAVLLYVAVISAPRSWLDRRGPDGGLVLRPPEIPCRPPSLAELCVLRT
ncbi:hypothetical protein LTV02_11725 [Nocardia yamanashiensis]|uniref:hypothetical protein n=1 Tax=Nocardia yamanashiensis TaxID=209247 RepID=UPI001E36EC74|nr:hypothetical protein [Nocardia yamanashiensis]UGT44004.1 hypothetical protein LTV02_11725 [Nocardia yamanashiensis]